MTTLNQSQQDALAKVKQLLDEHFEAWVVSYEAELDDRSDLTQVAYNGGKARAVGLATIARELLLHPPSQDPFNFDSSES